MRAIHLQHRLELVGEVRANVMAHAFDAGALGDHDCALDVTDAQTLGQRGHDVGMPHFEAGRRLPTRGSPGRRCSHCQ